MKKIVQKFLSVSFFCLATINFCIAQSSAKSQWVYPDEKGKLIYKMLENGDKIMDFSHAGYMGGGVSIPNVPVKITVVRQSVIIQMAIQKAIDEVSKMKLVNGFRGTVY
jgi:hypothetical protein